MYCSKTLENFVSITSPQLLVREKIAELTEQMQKQSSLHNLWIFPINFLTSVLGIALAPISFLIQAVAAATFACFICCDEDSLYHTLYLFRKAVSTLTDVPMNLLASIFIPSIEVFKPVSDHIYESFRPQYRIYDEI